MFSIREFPVLDRPGGARRSSLRRDEGCGMEFCDKAVVDGVNQRARPRRVHAGVMTCTTRTHHVRGSVSCHRRRCCGVGLGRAVQSADVVIT